MIRRAKLLSPLLIIVMLFSLMSGVLTAAVVTTSELASAAPADPALEADIISPSTSDWFCVNKTFSLKFYINETNDVPAYCVGATVDPGPKAAVADKECGEVYDTGILGNLPGDGSMGPIILTVKCCYPNDTTISVTPYGKTDDACTIAIEDITSDAITVHQTDVVLETVIWEPQTSDTFCVCENFTVSVTITNTGTATAYFVRGWIAISGNATADWPDNKPWPLGATITPGNSINIGWNVHCDSEGDSTISVNPTGQLSDVPGQLPIPGCGLIGDQITVHQVGAVLRSEISQPTCGGEICTCQDFTLTFRIYNDGTAPALGVGAIIDPGAHAEVDAHGEGVPWTTPVLVPTLANGASAGPFSYEMHCTSNGATMITVKPYGVSTGGYPIPDTNIIADCCEMYQEQLLEVVIDTPPPGVTVCVGETFGFVVTVTNYAAVNATNVYVNYTSSGSGGSIDPSSGSVGPLELTPGSHVIAFKPLTCTGTGDVEIEVTVNGTLGDAGCQSSANVTVHQAGLMVDIVTPANSMVIDTCQCFYVNAVVTNPCLQTVEGVTVNITWSGPGAVKWVKGGSPIYPHTQGPVPITGKGAEDFWWELHCDGAGDVTITVTAYAEGVPVGEDTVTVHQGKVLQIYRIEPPFVLPDGSIRPPDGFTVCPCDVFTVKAEICNESKNTTVTGIVATIDIDGPAELLGGGKSGSWTLSGGLAPGDCDCVIWTLHCIEAGTVKIKVNATYSGVGIIGAAVVPLIVTVHQAEEKATLAVEITDPETSFKVCAQCWPDFTVTAKITNLGCEAAEGVNAVLKQVGGGGSVIITEASKYIGTMPGLTSVTKTWDVTCTSLGDVDLRVDVTSTNDGNPQSNEVTIHQQDFIVEILGPGKIGPYSTCQDFTITARLYNCMDIALTHVWATISDYAAAGAELVGTVLIEKYDIDGHLIDSATVPAAATVYLSPVEPLCQCCYADVTWTLHCVGSAYKLPITVTAYESDIWLDEDSVLLTQEWKAHLVAGIDSYFGVIYDPFCSCPDIMPSTFSVDPVHVFGECQDFTVVVPVSNIGEAWAYDVTVSIHIEGEAEILPQGSGIKDATVPVWSADWGFGLIPGGESAKAIFELHCTAPGNVTITVTDISGYDWNTQEPIPPDNIGEVCPLYVQQVVPPDIGVLIIQPQTCWEFNACDDFCVKALVTNYGESPIVGVNATIYLLDPDTGLPTDRATLISGESQSKILGTMPGGRTFEVGWVVHCEKQGDVEIVVCATDATGYYADCDSVVVHQIVPAEINCKILSPGMGSAIATSQEFAVTAMIWNEVGSASVTIDSADLYFWPDPEAAEVIGGPVPDLVGYVLAGGESVVATWTVHCEKAGYECTSQYTEIEVNVTGHDEFDLPVNTSCYKYVRQYPAAHLEVLIIEPFEPVEYTVCDEFNVTAIVMNTGWADAWEVTATLSVEPEDSVRVTSGGYTQYIGTLAGYDNEWASWAMVTWQLHCKQPCESTITVTADGKDECGIQLEKDWQWMEGSIDGYYAGWFDGYYHGCTCGWWDGVISGEWHGWLEGYFTGIVYFGDYDFEIYDMEYFEQVVHADVMYGTFEGDHCGYYDGVVDGYFEGWKGKGGMDARVEIPDDGYGGHDRHRRSEFQGWFSTIVLVRNPGGHINEQFIEPDSITVKQMEAAVPGSLVVVDVVAPEQVYVGAAFEVVVVVANIGGTQATGVEATITISSGAHTPEALTKTVGTGTIDPGDAAVVSWMVWCDWESGVGISVSVEGDATNTAVGAATVQQTIDPDEFLYYLDSIAASLESIDGNVAIITTDIGDIEVLLADILIEVAVMADSLEDIEGCVCEIETILGVLTGVVTDISDGIATIHTDLGNLTVAVGDIHLVVPGEVSVNPWYWLIGPILGGFVILGLVIYLVAVRKRPPVPPPPPPTPGA